MNTVVRVVPRKLGKYEIRREIGRGGMGVVYEGHDPIIDRRVALKTLISDMFPPGPDADEYLARFTREAQAAGRLNHAHIVAVYDFGEDVTPGADGVDVKTAYLAMEFIEGRELKSFFDANQRFTVADVKRIMGELLDALQYSHSRGVVHRDIKPANIIILNDGKVKVADFGIARIDSSTLTQVGTILGSPNYMSPEQFTGQPVDGRSDLFSAAIVLYQLLTGEVPFAGSSSNVMHRILSEDASPPSVLNVMVPRAFDAVLRRGMAKRPDERYQSAAEFNQAIINASSAPAGVDGAATVFRTPGTASPPREGGTRRLRQSIAAACVLAIGAAAGAAWYFTKGPQANQANLAASNRAAPPANAAPTAIAPPDGAVPAAPMQTEAAASTTAPRQSQTAVVSAMGLADPNDPRSDKESTKVEGMVWGDARRQLILKAAALYVDPRSINANYGLLRTKLLDHSDQYITNVLDTPAPQISQYGLMVGTMRANVNVRDVQKALNRISHDDRVDFIRNNGAPRIAVSITSQSAEDDPAAAPQRSAVAENVLKERIRSYDFGIVDEQAGKTQADFLVDGEVRFKRLSARLPASGLTIEKFAITSWTIRAVDAKTGDEIYHDTSTPEKKSWATQELALRDVGRLIGEKFSKTFFLQYFDFGAQPVRLRFSGLPTGAAGTVLSEIDASLQVLNARLVADQGSDIVIDTNLSGGDNVATSELVQKTLLAPFNRKLGKSCFTVGDSESTKVHVLFDAACNQSDYLKRLETLPPEGLVDSPAERVKDVVRDPNFMRRTTI